MSSLARRTLRTSATIAGVAALGAGFAAQAFAADLPALPAAPELPTPGALAVPDLGAPAVPSLDSAPSLPELPQAFTAPGIANLEAPNVKTQSSSEKVATKTPAAPDAAVAKGAGAGALSTVPAASYEAAPAIPGGDALSLPGLGGELATPQSTVPLAAPALPSTQDQSFDAQAARLPSTSNIGAPDLASNIASLAG